MFVTTKTMHPTDEKKELFGDLFPSDYPSGKEKVWGRGAGAFMKTNGQGCCMVANDVRASETWFIVLFKD